MSQKYCLILGQRCNCSCIMCGIPGMGENIFLDSDDLWEFIDEWDLTNKDVIELCGGEPTIHPEFLEFRGSVVDNTSADVWVLSNGIRFADEEFSKAFAQIEVTGVVIPLYSHNPEIHDAVTQRIFIEFRV